MRGVWMWLRGQVRTGRCTGIVAVAAAVLMLAACGGNITPGPANEAGSDAEATLPADTPAAAIDSEAGAPESGDPEPASIATDEQPVADVGPVELHDVDLLQAAGAVSACDAGGTQPAADLLRCDPAADRAADPSADGAVTLPALNVDVDAGSFARWSLRWGEAASPLTGVETLALTLQHTGDLRPNLYLVEASGARLHVSLARYGFGTSIDAATQTLFIPLREIQDADGNRPDFAAVNELQLVFEWADMAGELTVLGVRFAGVWAEPVAPHARALTLAQALEVPPGFAVVPVAAGLEQMTQIDFTPNGDLLVSQQGGRVWWYRDTDGDGLYDRRHLYTTGFTEIVGLLYDPVDGAIWLGGRGQLYRTLDSTGNGVADQFELRLDGLPWGRHQNNGLAWNPQPDPFSDEDAHSWIYFGLGSTGDLEAGGPYNATILRLPRTGAGADDLEVVAQGVRNAYNVYFAPVPVDLAAPDGPHAWQLFAGENGPDFSGEPDELNHIRWGRHYGFPDQFGAVDAAATEGDPYSGPVYVVAPHASANGLAYITNPAWPAAHRTLYLSLFGEVFSPTPVGHTVEQIVLESVSLPDGTITYRGEARDFVVGLDRPLPLGVEPGGDLLVGDYATGIIYRVYYAGEDAGESAGD